MSKDSLTESQKKKLELESELKKIQSDIDESLEEVKHTATESLGPKSIIKKYPLPVVGVALVIGWLAGRPSKKSKTSSYRAPENETFGQLVGQEIKRLIVKRGISLLGDKIDEQISSSSNQQDEE